MVKDDVVRVDPSDINVYTVTALRRWLAPAAASRAKVARLESISIIMKAVHQGIGQELTDRIDESLNSIQCD